MLVRVLYVFFVWSKTLNGRVNHAPKNITTYEVRPHDDKNINRRRLSLLPARSSPHGAPTWLVSLRLPSSPPPAWPASYPAEALAARAVAEGWWWWLAKRALGRRSSTPSTKRHRLSWRWTLPFGRASRVRHTPNPFVPSSPTVMRDSCARELGRIIRTTASPPAADVACYVTRITPSPPSLIFSV